MLSAGEESPSSLLVGVGGAGCNAVSISELDRFGILSDDDRACYEMDLVRISGQEQGIFRTTAPHLLTIDLPSIKKLTERVRNKDIMFIFAGLGGETGSHTAPVLANISRRQVRLVVSIVCTPFSVEGRDRHSHADEGLAKLSQMSDLCIVLANDGLAKAAPQIQFRKAFRVMDQIMNFIPSELNAVLSKDSLREVREHFKECGQCRLGVGIGSGAYADRRALAEAFESPWFDFDLGDAPVCLAIFAMGENVEHLIEPSLKELSNRLPSASLLYAVRSDNDVADRVQATIILGLR